MMSLKSILDVGFILYLVFVVLETGQGTLGKGSSPSHTPTSFLL